MVWYIKFWYETAQFIPQTDKCMLISDRLQLILFQWVCLSIVSHLFSTVWQIFSYTKQLIWQRTSEYAEVKQVSNISGDLERWK